MAGRTGKMTLDAIYKRGPRLVLCQVTHYSGGWMPVIFRAGKPPFALDTGEFKVQLVAVSYSKSYLKRIGKAML